MTNTAGTGAGSTTNVIEVLVVEIDDLLRPVTRVVSSSDPLAALRRLLRSAGWRMTDMIDPAPIVTGIETLIDVLDAVLNGIDPQDLTEFLGALDEIRQLIASIEDLTELIATAGPVPPTDAELAVFAEDLLHALLTQWILRKAVIGDVANLIGLLEVVDLPAAQVGGWLARRPVRASRLRPAMVTEFLTDPLGYLADRVVPNGWATSTDAAATNQLLANQLEPLLARVGGAWRIHANSLASADSLRTAGRLGLLEVVARVADDDGRSRFGAEVEFFSSADTNDAGQARRWRSHRSAATPTASHPLAGPSRWARWWRSVASTRAIRRRPSASPAVESTSHPRSMPASMSPRTSISTRCSAVRARGFSSGPSTSPRSSGSPTKSSIPVRRSSPPGVGSC
jgi:hypothetical protein